MESQALNSYINYQDIEVAWLPSMPLINKRRAPAIAGIGILYSEESDQVFDAFETANLASTLRSSSRQQSVALSNDPNCRICWLEIQEGGLRKQALHTLVKKMRQETRVIPFR